MRVVGKMSSWENSVGILSLVGCTTTNKRESCNISGNFTENDRFHGKPSISRFASGPSSTKSCNRKPIVIIIIKTLHHELYGSRATSLMSRQQHKIDVNVVT